MKINKSKAPAKGWVKKALCGSTLMGLAMTMGATSAVADKVDQFKSFTPVSRIATIPLVEDEPGVVNYPASYARAREASVALATYVATLKESAAEVLGSDVIKGVDWKLGGTSEDCISKGASVPTTCSEEEIDEAVLMIPSPYPINPNMPISDTNPIKKANVLDFCNGKYASLAMGVEPIIGSKSNGSAKYVVNGYSHAPALPCEVSIWLDDDNIKVDMLRPEAIFTLFFSDVLFSKEMQNKNFAKALNEMTVQVNSEIKAIILDALTKHADSEYVIKEVNEEIGPVYDSMKDIIDVVDSSTYNSPYMHMSYTKLDGGVFTDGESKAVAQTIINTLSTHKNAPGVHTTYLEEDIEGNTVTDREGDGDTVINLDDVLSTGSSWRSARLEPISIPGKNHIIEACSPKYAKMAMGTGLSHVNALPCEITVKTIDGGNKLVVSYLDPDFMLKSLFADISNKEKKQFGEIPEIIMTDLQNVVAAALDNIKVDADTVDEYEIDLNPGVQISYDMLPQDD